MLVGRARPYMNDSDPRRQNQPNRMTMPPWIKPALYAAGGTALLVFAWPALRFVIIGGLAYGAVKLVRLWISWRQEFSWGRGAVDNVSEFKTVAQLSLQAACLRRDAIVAEILPDSVDDRSITLADATDVQIVGGNRVKAVFPVLIDGQQSGLYVSASGSVAEGVLVEAVSVYTQLRSGQIVEASIEVSSSDGEDDSSSYRGAQRQTKRKVKDAEYKDL
ncbi:hypothetical protein EV175_001641 [Coemansia sp. RSA 1933]|nr:hypothetical protein EV175_001641 [Coemansia sp. RSA 1933]